MITGTDRSRRKIPGGTRHPCPFCDWYLDAEPVYPRTSDRFVTSFMQLERRFNGIQRRVANHIRTDHPQEYAEATTWFSAGKEDR